MSTENFWLVVLAALFGTWQGWIVLFLLFCLGMRLLAVLAAALEVVTLPVHGPASASPEEGGAGRLPSCTFLALVLLLYWLFN